MFCERRRLDKTLAGLVALVLITPALFNVPVGHAEIYRWQDQQGHWHFSDSPPSDIETERFTGVSGTGAVQPIANETETSVGQSQSLTTAGEAGVFWRVAKPGLQPSHLLGTIHSTDARVIRLRPDVQTALDAADRFVMEMIMDTNALLAFGTSIMLTDGSDLETLLGPGLFNRVVSVTAGYGFPEMAVRQLKPWVVMAMLSMPKPTGEPILDMVLYQRAQSRGKATSGLESAQEQLAVFEGLPLDDQVELLKMTLDQLPSLPELFEALLQAYQADDLGRIATLANQYKTRPDLQSLKRFMFRLNDERNRRMVQRTIPYLESGNAFIAVGALHLAGPAGLVSLLRERGYTLTPVR